MGAYNLFSFKSQILGDVEEVLNNIIARGGLVPHSFTESEYKRIQGRFAAIVLNVAFEAAIGHKAVQDDPRFTPSEAQYAVLVEATRQQFPNHLAQIRALRTAKGK